MSDRQGPSRGATPEDLDGTRGLDSTTKTIEMHLAPSAPGPQPGVEENTSLTLQSPLPGPQGITVLECGPVSRTDRWSSLPSPDTSEPVG